MATATRKRTSKKSTRKAQSAMGRLNTEALKTSEELIEGSIKTGAKYQNLYAKSLKKTEPIIAKNINIAFDTVETVVDQYKKSSKRALALFGWDVKDVEKATEKAVSSAKKAAKPATKRAASIVKKATATATKAKKATEKVVNTAKKEVKASTKTVAAKVKNQTPATKAVTSAKKTAAKTVASTKKASTKATTAVKNTAVKVTSKIDSTNLTLINGVGPKMEALLKKEGYPTLESISKATVADLKKVLDRADARYRLLNPESWVKDAKKALK